MTLEEDEEEDEGDLFARIFKESQILSPDMYS